MRNCIGLTILIYEVEVLGYVLNALNRFGDLSRGWHVSHVNFLISLLDWAKELLRSITVTLLSFV